MLCCLHQKNHLLTWKILQQIYRIFTYLKSFSARECFGIIWNRSRKTHVELFIFWMIIEFLATPKMSKRSLHFASQSRNAYYIYNKFLFRLHAILQLFVFIVFVSEKISFIWFPFLVCNYIIICIARLASLLWIRSYVDCSVPLPVSVLASTFSYMFLDDFCHWTTRTLVVVVVVFLKKFLSDVMNIALINSLDVFYGFKFPCACTNGWNCESRRYLKLETIWSDDELIV